MIRPAYQRARSVAKQARSAARDLGDARRNAGEVARLRERIAALGAERDPGDTPPVYGATRYSIFNPGGEGWLLAQGARKDPEPYMRELWAPERMAPREHAFLEWATPIYQRFHDEYGYRHLVQYSPEMPARWVDALHDAAATYPVLALLPKGRWTDRVQWLADDIRRRRVRTGPAAWLRIDDDDLLSTTYMERLLGYVTEAHMGWGVSFGAGITAEYGNGRLSNLGVTARPLVSMGQAYIGQITDYEVTWPPTASHVKVHKEMPTILDSRETAYLRLLHENQDRNALGDVDNPTHKYDPRLVEQLRDHFPTVVDSVDVPSDAQRKGTG